MLQASDMLGQVSLGIEKETTFTEWVDWGHCHGVISSRLLPFFLCDYSLHKEQYFKIQK